MKLLPIDPAFENLRKAFGFHDDFLNDEVSANVFAGWTVTATDSGTATVGDAAGGIMTLAPSDGTVADNDEIYLFRKAETFLFAADKPLNFRSRLKFVEANTDDANVLVGLIDAPAANTLLDTGGGPKASYSGAVFFKVDGGTVWNFETSLAGAQTTTTLENTAGGSAYHELEIEFRPIDSTVAELIPFIDGVQCRDSNGNPVKHRYTFTNATEMVACIGVKNGDTNNEAVLVDYVQARQLR